MLCRLMVMKKLHVLFLSFLFVPFLLGAQEVIEEAKVMFELPDKWTLQQKAGSFDDGLVQYFYQREPVQTAEGTEAYPAVIFILDKVNGTTLDDYAARDIRTERNGRLSSGQFEQVKKADVDGLDARLVEVRLEDSGYRLRTLIYYFINNDTVVKLILNTISDPNPSIAEIDAIIESLKQR